MATRSAGTYVEVLYDYTYTTNDGEKIAVQQGDECLLLKKANVDWWSVIPTNQPSGQKKPLYVPANYVREKPRNTPKTHRKLEPQTSLQDEVFENGNESSTKKEEEKTNNNSLQPPDGKDGTGVEKRGGKEGQPAVIMRPKSGLSLKRPQSVPPPPPDKPKAKPPTPPEKPKPAQQQESSEKVTIAFSFFSCDQAAPLLSACLSVRPSVTPFSEFFTMFLSVIVSS